ncbi:MAG: prepilin-type N-terminal cleavage/methylation domain-containing protein [Candidatus Pacebacteria bacterium]|nr:prepilin-type N-terminal cleavage/methylation domain-containing protein [Candidatus Paceibacterota bacterium]
MKNKKETAEKYRHLKDRASFTMVELVVVLGILAVLSTVAVLALRPDQLFKQSRDSKRLSDLQTIHSALALYLGFSLTGFGDANKVYVSVPDTSATCANLALPDLPDGWTYVCKPTATYRNIDGTGWIPVDLSLLFANTGSIFSSLPVDSVNSVVDGQYYTYITGGSWALTALLESDKYLRNEASKDGGTDSGRLELGTDLSLWRQASGLVGYWKFEEGSGTTANDSSNNANTGTWGGTGSPHYVTGKVQDYAGSFNGSNDEVNVGTGESLNITDNMSVVVWAYPLELKYQTPLARSTDTAGIARQFKLYFYGDGRLNFRWFVEDGAYGTLTNCITTGAEYAVGGWYHMVMTFSNGVVRGYKNGALLKECDQGANTINDSALPVYIGRDSTSYYFNGYIDDARIYNRVLSAQEILAMYNANK